MRMPECRAKGSGASRVQITKPSGAGSPEAIPSVNGVREGRVCARSTAGAATAPASPPSTVRRTSVGKVMRRRS